MNMEVFMQYERIYLWRSACLAFMTSAIVLGHQRDAVSEKDTDECGCARGSHDHHTGCGCDPVYLL